MTAAERAAYRAAVIAQERDTAAKLRQRALDSVQGSTWCGADAYLRAVDEAAEERMARLVASLDESAQAEVERRLAVLVGAVEAVVVEIDEHYVGRDHLDDSDLVEIIERLRAALESKPQPAPLTVGAALRITHVVEFLKTHKMMVVAARDVRDGELRRWYYRGDIDDVRDAESPEHLEGPMHTRPLGAMALPSDWSALVWRALVHELKTWPEPFDAIVSGEKRHEIRKTDRPFAVGDRLLLREWEPRSECRSDAGVYGHYTGRRVTVRVTYLTPGGAWGLPTDLCVMSVALDGAGEAGR